MNEVTIYTDGGCQPNPGVGGWAAILIAGDRVRELSGGEQQSTNNRMELTAAIEGLKALKRRCRVQLYTDSQYMRQGITSWIKKWRKNGWKTASGPVKNKELWVALDALCEQHDVHWHWTQGHAGDPLNERCDELASAAIARARMQ
ncbi:MAG: ribonuclease HI [Candidatus Hydrogenedens sp.]|nr:ribonuclease HI [Candidatus Hydrogenedens sp.]